VHVDGTGGTDFIADVNGFYGPTPSGLSETTPTFSLNTNSLTATMRLDNSSTTCVGACGLFQTVHSGTAIQGQSFSVSGSEAGVYGLGVSTMGVKGASTTGVGVLGTSTSNLGVRGTSDSNVGVQGISNSNAGVQGTSTSAYGVMGTSTTNAGVRGVGFSNAAEGVSGVSLDSIGAVQTLGYLGYSNSAAGMFFGPVLISSGTGGPGNLTVVGTLSKGGGTFKIDHPLDPENKYLYHSFVESPDMMNIYNGIVALDALGEAIVRMPDYFEALNSDFRYQLTSIGQAQANLFIADEIQNLTFRIAGGKPHARVSWQVTGIRKDPFANANRVVAEVEKEPQAKGYYLHPAAYRQPVEKSLVKHVVETQKAEALEQAKAQRNDR
jgi:hypothetical protein